MAVTAFPTIKVNSATGSDTAASGAGPATALTGTAATTDATGLIVTLDGSPDLSGIATDGSATLRYLDGTAGAVNNVAINAADNTAKTVTVEQALALSHAATAWAIGGKLASIGSSDSLKLFDNNGSTGDAQPGWTIEMESGHTETLTGALNMRVVGDSTDGAIMLQGESGAVAMPVLTFSGNTDGIVVRGDYTKYFNFEISSSAAKSSGRAVVDTATYNLQVSGVTIGSTAGANDWAAGIQTHSSAMIDRCDISGTDIGVKSTGSGFSSPVFFGNYIHDCSDHCLLFDAGSRISPKVVFNIIARATNAGIEFDNTRTDAISSGAVFASNTIYGHGGNGVTMLNTTFGAHQAFLFVNNLVTDNTGYGFSFGNGKVTVEAAGRLFLNNGWKSNSSGDLNYSGIDEGSITDADVDNASFGTGSDFGLGSASDLKAAGFPGAFLGGDMGYLDVGAVQRQEPAGGSGGGWHVSVG